MPDNSLSPDLVQAARTVDERFSLLKVPSRKILESEWGDLPSKIRSFVPAWIPVLLSTFRLVGGVLEYRDFKRPSTRQFSFFAPTDYASALEAGSLFGDLPRSGFIPIAYEYNGSVWVKRINEDFSGAIYLLSLPDWNGGQPTLTNGLVFASTRLSLLLASMGVSEVSYYERPGGITSVLWNEEK